MPAGSMNFFDASGIGTHLVCPKDDPSGKKLEKALADRMEQRRTWRRAVT
jgi:hypothetical protein